MTRSSGDHVSIAGKIHTGSITGLTYRPRRRPPQQGVGQGRDVGIVQRQIQRSAATGALHGGAQEPLRPGFHPLCLSLVHLKQRHLTIKRESGSRARHYLRQVAEAAGALGVLVDRFQFIQRHFWSRVVLALLGGGMAGAGRVRRRITLNKKKTLYRSPPLCLIRINYIFGGNYQQYQFLIQCFSLYFFVLLITLKKLTAKR